jgi:hypothetical protein
MRRHLVLLSRGVAVLAALGAVVAIGATNAAASAYAGPAGSGSERDVVASVKDPRGDVRNHQRIRGLTTKERKSIDVRQVTVDVRESVTRFSVELEDVRRTNGWDQMVFLNIEPTAGSTEGFGGSIGFSPQRSTLSYAYLDFSGDGTDLESCDPLRAKVSWQRDLVSLDVPRRCLPSSEAMVKVRSYTGYFRSDASGPWSSDRAKFNGPAVLR